ncbi:MAG TPA: ATP-binding protein [Burkholderiales bacterium]|jgi:PAS domain S-box-containing protein
MRPLATLSPPPSKLTRAAQLAYGLAAFIATAAIWGWAIDLPRLRDLGADFAPMAPGEALAFLLLASSFYASHHDDYRSRRAAYSAAAVAGAIGLFGLVEALSGESLGMSFGVAAMSSATCIMVLALALVTPLARDFKIIGLSANGVAAGAIGAVAFFALLGASLRVLRFDIGAPLLALSGPGTVAALFAAFALAMGRPTPWLIDTLSSRRTGAVVTRWLLPAAFFVPMTIGWIRLLAEREGLFGEAFGMSLFTFIIIGTFSALVLWVARTLDRIAAQRAQAEVQADEQREWLQVTLAAIGDGVIATDGGGRVRFLNAAAQRLTGWRADEAGGRPVAELLSLFDERDGRTIESPLQMALRRRTAAAAGGEPALRARDGSVHPVDVNAAPIVDSASGLAGAVIVLREAAVQRQAERAMREAYTELDQRVIRRTAALERASAALRERNALLNAITASTPDLIVAKDRQGRTLMANPAWVKAMGKVEHDVVALDDKERLVLDSGEAMIIEDTVDQRTYLTTKAPLRDEQSRIIGLIGVATDITERKRGQHELEKLVVAEQRLRAEAERANRAKDEFLAIVSHELRSPLNALRGWSHLLATTRPLEQTLVERAAKAIKRNVDHQTRLIDDLLDTSRIVSGKLNIERRVVNLAEIVNSALEATRPGAAAKETTLRFTAGDPVMVVGDAGRLQQLASNLISNAVKFTPERGLVQVSLLKNGERVQLVVKDNGLGIAPEFLPHVFDRFTQADTTSARRAGGLGIGLALVRHISLLHGGQVRADSPGLGKGATFTVDLPAAPLAAALAAIGAPSPDQRRRASENALADVRVWIADDDPDAHEVVALTLKQSGAVVQSFGSGRQLVDALEGMLAKDPPDVLLLDLAMPDQDGFETLRRARSLELAAGIDQPTPAIALTAFTQVERERLRAAGFTDRVDKPVDADKLIAAIRAALKDRQPAKTGTR